MTDLKNPVSEFYKNYQFNPTLPIVFSSNLDEMLKSASTAKSSTIFINRTPTTISSPTVISLKIPANLEIILVLNLTVSGKGQLTVSGSNFSLSNIEYKNQDPSFTYPNHFLYVDGSSIKIINLEMVNVKCKNADLDYFRVRESATNFELHNSLLDGKTNIGVFLRLDFPFKHLLKQCVMRNFSKISSGNGGEMVRLATSPFFNKDAFCVIENCLFSNCQGDPEVVSVKCASVTIRNCIFEKNGGKRLTLRSTNRDRIENCYFSQDGVRAYGEDHVFENIQLVDGANILLDNKSGSYVVAKNCKLNNIYYFNGENPVTNKGINCVVSNVSKQLKITRESLFTKGGGIPIGPTGISPTGPIVVPTGVLTGSATGSTGPISASSFNFMLEKNRIIGNPIKILPTEKFTVLFKPPSGLSPPFTFTIKNKSTGAVVLTKTEKLPDYYLFGNLNEVINYNSINIVGDYILEISNYKSEKLEFSVVAKL